MLLGAEGGGLRSTRLFSSEPKKGTKIHEKCFNNERFNDYCFSGFEKFLKGKQKTSEQKNVPPKEKGNDLYALFLT